VVARVVTWGYMVARSWGGWPGAGGPWVARLGDAGQEGKPIISSTRDNGDYRV